MPKAKTKPPDEIALLADRFLELLEANRERAGNSPPSTVADLARECDLPIDDDRVARALKKPSFRGKVKTLGGGSAAKLYFKENFPTKAELERITVADLADRLLRVLESQRELGGTDYPPTWARLVTLAGEKPSATLPPKALKWPSMAEATTIASTGKPDGDAPILFTRDLAGGQDAWGETLIAFTFAKATKPAGKGKKPNFGFTAKQLAAKLSPPLRLSFENDLRSRVDREAMPEAYGWLPNPDPLLFRLADVRPSAPFRVADEPPRERSQTIEPVLHTPPRTEPTAPARDFAEAFQEAFERIDVQNRRTNNVRLLDLRQALADFDRTSFDAGLRLLRQQRRFSLDSHDGMHHSLTVEEREAGISEQGSLLVYVSTRR